MMSKDKHSGQILDGRYELIQLLDEGGMGTVYLGRHIKLGRKAAVKFLHSELASNKELVTRFYREAQAASAISHTNIIDVFDVGVSEWGEPFLVMEYLSGENLGSLLKRKGFLDLAAACGVLEPALRALLAAHEQGIVHRDLKPENIFLTRQDDAAPVVKVIDFGISKFASKNHAKLTQTGALLGTPSYMSPEQARGKGNFDHRADIYSMGVILFRMLTGELPFVGESYNDLIITILTEAPRDPESLNASFPEAARPIINRLLEKEPDDRYRNCQELIEALESLEEYNNRQAALAELANDMPDDCFATGDLGDEIAQVDEVAATLFAGMGPNGINTVDLTPATASQNGDTEEEKSEKSEKVEGELEKSLRESEELVTVPPPSQRRFRRERSLFPSFLMVVAVLVAAGWLMYSKGLLVTATDPSVLHGDEIDPISEDMDEIMIDDPKSGTGLSNRKRSSASSMENSHKLGASNRVPDVDENLEDETPQKGTLVKDTVSSKSELPSDQKGEKPLPDVERDPSDPFARKSDIVESQAAASSTSKSPTVSSSGEKSGETKTSGKKEAAPANPGVSQANLRALTPQAVNNLVEKKAGRVQRCYDLARIENPYFSGKMQLRVGMSGHKVEATVIKNELNAKLATCVIRAIKSIVPPPNDGTLVEIAKEYEFQVSE